MYDAFNKIENENMKLHFVCESHRLALLRSQEKRIFRWHREFDKDQHLSEKKIEDHEGCLKLSISNAKVQRLFSGNDLKVEDIQFSNSASKTAIKQMLLDNLRFSN